MGKVIMVKTAEKLLSAMVARARLDRSDFMQRVVMVQLT
jgi:hypothetical protein